jgi:hypothetical protein
MRQGSRTLPKLVCNSTLRGNVITIDYLVLTVRAVPLVGVPWFMNTMKIFKIYLHIQWKRMSRKQSARWQHLSQL